MAGATSGAGTLACALFCSNGVAAADLSAPPDAPAGALVAGLTALVGALVTGLSEPLGTAVPGCRAIGLSEVVPLMLKFYRDAAPHAPPRRTPAPH